MTEAQRRELAEIAAAFGPVLADLFEQRPRAELRRDAAELVLKVVGHHLLLANGAVLLADLRAARDAGADMLEWLGRHAETVEPSKYDGMGG